MLNVEGNKRLKFVKDWIIPIGCAIILAMLINKFIIFKVEVPSGSMKPTVMIGDQMFVTRIYKPENIKRGEILVFKKDGAEELLLKRVIGLPGDTIEIKDGGKVYINGEFLDEPYVKYPDSLSGVYHVPARNYFMVGDNRAGSGDARQWKEPYIPEENILARTLLRVYPFDRVGFIKE